MDADSWKQPCTLKSGSSDADSGEANYDLNTSISSAYPETKVDYFINYKKHAYSSDELQLQRVGSQSLVALFFQMMILAGCSDLVFDLPCLKRLLGYFICTHTIFFVIKALLALFVIPNALF